MQDFSEPLIESEHFTEENKLHKNLGLKFFTNYYKKTNKKKVAKTVMLILCGFAVAFAGLAYAAGNGFSAEQEKMLNQLSDKEILLVNQTAPSLTILDYNENLSISPELFEKIKTVEHVESIYPFFEFRSSGTSFETMGPFDGAGISISENSQNIRECTFSTSAPQFKTFSLQPYYPEQPYHKQLEHKFQTTDESKAVYISSSLAHLLSISQKTEKCQIKVDAGIPVAVYPIDLQVSGSNTQAGSSNFTYPADIDVSVVTSLEFEIAGILSDNVKNSYSASGNNVIYVPFQTMTEIQKRVQNSIKINS